MKFRPTVWEKIENEATRNGIKPREQLQYIFKVYFYARFKLLPGCLERGTYRGTMKKSKRLQVKLPNNVFNRILEEAYEDFRSPSDHMMLVVYSFFWHLENKIESDRFTIAAA